MPDQPVGETPTEPPSEPSEKLGGTRRESTSHGSLRRSQGSLDRSQGSLHQLTRLAQMAVFTAIVAVLGQIAIPLGPVPITLQTLGVMLAGAVLGPWRGAGSMIVLNALAALGLPVMAMGSGGLGVFASPAAGFALGFIPGAWVVGAVVQAHWPLRLLRSAVGIVLGGIVVVYAVGIPVMAYQLGLSLSEAFIANSVFIPGDLLKAGIALAVTHTLVKAYPGPFSYAQRKTRNTTQHPGLSQGRSQAPGPTSPPTPLQ